MSASLELREISYTHPGAGHAAVDAVTLPVTAGDLLAVVGPSGSGKTTLLRLIAGLTAPDRGDLLVGGRSVLETPPERRGMAMMFQKPHLFPHLDVLGNVAFADRVKGVPRRQARDTAGRFLDLVHLGGLGTRRTRQLSGGQEQRVALARALAAGPHILLLDEPFSALDTELRWEMHTLLAEVRAALGPTGVMVTHDMAEAALADSVAVLIAGELVQHGTLDELYRRPASIAVARLLGGFSEVPGTLDGQGHHHSILGRIAVQHADVPGLGGQPTVLLVRQEAVHLVEAHDPDAMAIGVVVGSSRSGPRYVAEIEVAAAGSRVRVRAELPPGRRPEPGRTVGLRTSGTAAVAPALHEPTAPNPLRYPSRLHATERVELTPAG